MKGISHIDYFLQSMVEKELLEIATYLASDYADAKALHQALLGLTEIKERRDKLIFASFGFGNGFGNLAKVQRERHLEQSKAKGFPALP